MKKILFLTITILLPLIGQAQITKPHEVFTDVYTYNGKVVFIKEIVPSSGDADLNYQRLKEWAKENFGKDPFNSNINYNKKEKSMMAQSRVELILPKNSLDVEEKIQLKYRLNMFFEGSVCILEFSELNYINSNKDKTNSLGQKIKAEDLISDQALLVRDQNQETRINTKKSTLYFLNELTNSLQKRLE